MGINTNLYASENPNINANKSSNCSGYASGYGSSYKGGYPKVNTSSPKQKEKVKKTSPDSIIRV